MELLSIILDSLLIVLVIVAIIIGIKLLDTLTKVDSILDSTKRKLDSLDTAFNFLDTVNNKLTLITDTAISSILSVTKKIFKRKKEEDIDE